MGYYQGDHYRSGRYRGDYYRGDPGFFSFIGNALKSVAKIGVGVVTGYLGGGVKGAIAGAVGGSVEATASGIRRETLAAGGDESAYTPEMAARHVALVNAPPALRAPGAGTAMIGPGGGMSLAVLRGHRLNKSTYVTRGGGTSRWPQQLVVHAKASEQVKIRRMNVGNTRALRRAIRRARGFAKLARRVITVSRQFKGGRKRAHK